MVTYTRTYDLDVCPSESDIRVYASACVNKMYDLLISFFTSVYINLYTHVRATYLFRVQNHHHESATGTLVFLLSLADPRAATWVRARFSGGRDSRVLQTGHGSSRYRRGGKKFAGVTTNENKKPKQTSGYTKLFLNDINAGYGLPELRYSYPRDPHDGHGREKII